MPSRWEVMLSGPSGAAIPLTAPQAVVSGWLDDPPSQPRAPGSADGQGTRAHTGPVRGWACGPFRTTAADGAGNPIAVTIMQIRLLDDELEDRLHEAVRPGRPVRLGSCHYQIAAPGRLADRTDWANLRAWSGERAWQMRFDTPVCFRRGNRTSPWPAPESVARGLAERWQRLHPATAPAPPGPGGGQVWVSDVDGRSQVQILDRHGRPGKRAAQEVVSGFTGRIRYVCDRGSEVEASTFGALLAFATYAGAGSHTTYGFGVVCPEPTWQPPSVRGAEW
jgi:CRISPR-associated endoribonuclease Cas6